MITDAGLKPLPPVKSIPIWFGGTADPVLRRVAEIGDGWMPLGGPDDSRKEMIEKFPGDHIKAIEKFLKIEVDPKSRSVYIIGNKLKIK